MTSCTVLNTWLGPIQTLNPFILLQYQSWHQPAVISSAPLSGEWVQASSNTPASEWTRLNDVGEKWRATGGGNKKSEGLSLVVFPNWQPRHGSALSLRNKGCTCRDLPVCLELGNVSCMPNHPPHKSPKLRPCQTFALSSRPLCWVSSIDSTLSRHASQRLSTSTLIYFLDKLCRIMLSKQCTKLIYVKSRTGLFVSIFRFVSQCAPKKKSSLHERSYKNSG